jgi:hypothetical protein
MDDKGRGFDSRHLHLIMALTCGDAAIGVELPSRLLVHRQAGLASPVTVDRRVCCIYAYTHD